MPKADYRIMNFESLVKTCRARNTGNKLIPKGECPLSADGRKCEALVEIAKDMIRKEQYDAMFPCIQYIRTCDDLRLKKEEVAAPIALESL